MKNNSTFRPGDLIVYHNGPRYEIGKIKSITKGAAFVWYSTGDTAALTSFEDMHKLVNEYCITKTDLGGQQS